MLTTRRVGRCRDATEAQDQYGGVSVSRAAWRTAISRPKPDGESSSRSAMSACVGSGHARPSGTRPRPRSHWPVRASDTCTCQLPPSCARRMQRGQRAEGQQVAGGVVQRLAGQRLRRRPVAGGLGLGVVEAAGGLHQAIEAAPAAPGADGAVGGERDADDPRAQARQRPAARSRGRRGARAVALHEHVRACASRPRSVAAPAWSRRSSEAERLPRPVSVTRSSRFGQVRALMRSTSAPCAAERAAADRAGDDARQVQHAQAGSGRPAAAAAATGGASPIRSIETAGRPATAWPCGCASHSAKLRMAATHMPASAAASSKSKPSQPRSGGSHRVAVVGAAEQAQHAVAVVREVRVQPHPAAVAASDRRRRCGPSVSGGGPALDAECAFGAEFGRGVAHVDRDALAAAGALAPDRGGGEGGGGDGRLRRGADGEGGRQHRVGAGQRQVVEGGGRHLRLRPQRRHGFDWLRHRSSPRVDIGRTAAHRPPPNPRRA